MSDHYLPATQDVVQDCLDAKVPVRCYESKGRNFYFVPAWVYAVDRCIDELAKASGYPRLAFRSGSLVWAAPHRDAIVSAEALGGADAGLQAMVALGWNFTAALAESERLDRCRKALLEGP